MLPRPAFVSTHLPAQAGATREASIVNGVIKQLKSFTEDELLAVSEAIDMEMERRMDREDIVPDSARRRAIQRQQSYRKSTGSSAPRVALTGMKGHRRRRFAA